MLRRALLALAIAAIAAGLFLEWRDRPRRRLPPGAKSIACPAGPLFSRPPIAPGSLAAVVPLGHVVPPAHVFPTTQLNLYLSRNEHGNVISAPLVAPGPLRITSIARKESLDPAGRPIAADYTLYYEVCEGVTGQFMLVSSLDPALARDIGDLDGARCNTYETGGARFRFCAKEVLVSVEAGAPLGIAGRSGNDSIDLMDWGLHDRRRPPLARANPARDREPDFEYTVCPLDALADSSDKRSLEAKLGLPDGTRRAAEPRCGLPSHDLPGTAQGAWYRPNTPNLPEDEHLALIPDPINPARGVFSIGIAFAALLQPQIIRFTPDPENTGIHNRAFATLYPGDSACYDHLEGSGPHPFHGIIRLTLESDNHLLVSVADGQADCAAPPPPPERIREVRFDR